MKKFPWKAICISCAILVVLVIGRCAVTIGRAKYYQRTDGMDLVRNDAWLYVGIAAAAVFVISFIVLVIQLIKRKKNDGCQ